METGMLDRDDYGFYYIKGQKPNELKFYSGIKLSKSKKVHLISLNKDFERSELVSVLGEQKGDYRIRTEYERMFRDVHEYNKIFITLSGKEYYLGDFKTFSFSGVGGNVYSPGLCKLCTFPRLLKNEKRINKNYSKLLKKLSKEKSEQFNDREIF